MAGLTPILVAIFICAEPMPARCLSDPDAMLTVPVCIAAATSCTIEQSWAYAPPDATEEQARGICLAKGRAMFAAEREKGPRWGRLTECFPRSDEP